MMPQDQPVRQTITHVIGKSIQPLARAAGFTKRRFNFHRRQGDLIQAINVQLAPFNIGPKGGFYVNLGIAFDRLRELMDWQLTSVCAPRNAIFIAVLPTFARTHPICGASIQEWTFNASSIP